MTNDAAKPAKKKRCGIDLGTTFCAISYYEEFKRDVVTVDVDPFAGTSTLRSVVYYEPVMDADGNFQRHNVVVGETAYRKRHADEQRVFQLIKRRMGTDWTHEIDGVKFTPEKISGDLLRALVDKAKEAIGEFDEVVVTVPAYFGDPERDATREAIKAAGLKELKLLEEPAAAALAVSLENPDLVSNRLLMVYDLGGGTFDATLIRTKNVDRNGQTRLEVDTLAKEGLRIRGGVDWNNRLHEFAAAKAVEEFQVDPQEQPATRLTFEEQCEEAKRMLSTAETAEIMATLMGQYVSITREQFNDITASELAETEALFQLIVDEAETRLKSELEDDEETLNRYEDDLRTRLQNDREGWEKVLEVAEEEHSLTVEQIEASPRELIMAMPRVMIDVLLCGGSTKMPMVSEMIERVIGRKPISHGNPELLVTRGAAYAAYVHADAETGETKPIETPSGLVVVEEPTSVAAETVGVETVSKTDHKTKEFAPLLVKGTAWGDKQKKTLKLKTTMKDMETIEVVIREGKNGEDAPHINDTRVLGEAVINVPPGREAGERVDVTIWSDSDGIICGEALDLATKKKIEFKFDRKRQ